MAVASIAVPPDPARDARARELVPFVASWPRHTLKVAWGSFSAGTTFRRATGSRGARYLVNSVACECSDYQKSEQVCKHIRAVVLFEQQQARPAPSTLDRLAVLYPPCAGGCGDLVERKGERCYPCLSAETHRQDLARKRELVANL